MQAIVASTATVPQGPEYVIYKSGATYYAVNGATGGTAYSGATLDGVLTSVSTALSSTGGSVRFKHSTAYVLAAAVSFPAFVLVDFGGSSIDVTAINAPCFVFGTDADPGSHSLDPTYDRLTGCINGTFLGATGNTSTWVAKICNICSGTRFQNIMTVYVNNGVQIVGLAYNALVSDCCFNYHKGTAVQLYGRAYGGAAPGQNANDAKIVNIETLGTSDYTAVGIDNANDGLANSTSAEGVRIVNCWLEREDIGIQTSGKRTFINGCNLGASELGGTNRTCINILTGADHTMIENNVIAAVTTTSVGIKDANNKFNVITGNFFNYLDGTGISGTNCQLSVISNNKVTLDNAQSGATFIAGTWNYCTIVGNDVFTGTTPTAGIGGNLADCAIVGNTFRGCATCIKPSGGSGIACIGNQFTGVGTAGIDMTSASTPYSLIGNVGDGITCITGVAASQAPNIVGNGGYLNRAAGTINFTAATTVNVTHGLVATPTKVVVTGSDTNSSALWVTAIGATTFTVNRGNSTGTPAIYWWAEV